MMAGEAAGALPEVRRVGEPKQRARRSGAWARPSTRAPVQAPFTPNSTLAMPPHFTAAHARPASHACRPPRTDGPYYRAPAVTPPPRASPSSSSLGDSSSDSGSDRERDAPHVYLLPKVRRLRLHRQRACVGIWARVACALMSSCACVPRVCAYSLCGWTLLCCHPWLHALDHPARSNVAPGLPKSQRGAIESATSTGASSSVAVDAAPSDQRHRRTGEAEGFCCSWG